MAGNDVAIYDLRVVGNGDVGIANAGSTMRLIRVGVTGCNAKNKPAVEAQGRHDDPLALPALRQRGGGITTDAHGIVQHHEHVHRSQRRDRLDGRWREARRDVERAESVRAQHGRRQHDRVRHVCRRHVQRDEPDDPEQHHLAQPRDERHASTPTRTRTCSVARSAARRRRSTTRRSSS